MAGMKKREIVVTLFTLLSLPATGAWGEESTVRIYGDIRYRYEDQKNFNLKYYGADPGAGEKSDGFLLQRIRLGWRWRPVPQVELALGLQDSRAFDLALGDHVFYKNDLGLEHNSYKDYLEPYNTYIQAEDVLFENLTIKAGRQLIYYGNNRVFGPGQWGNSGRYQWDAVKASYKLGKHFIDGFWGAHIIHDPGRSTLSHRHYFYGSGLYSHFVVSPGCTVEPFLVMKYDTHDNFRGESGQSDYNGYFSGTRLYGRIKDRVFYDLTYVRQWGNYGRDNISAFGYHLLAGYSFADSNWRPAISLEFSYASGDDDPDDGKRRTFNGVFGARDKMYGRMNLFDWSNLADYQLNFSCRPLKNLDIKTEFHKFRVAEAEDGWSLNPKLYRDKSGISGREVGSEFDLVCKYSLKPFSATLDDELILQAGYSHFRPGRFTKKVADDVEADWFFLQLQYKFTL